MEDVKSYGSESGTTLNIGGSNEQKDKRAHDSYESVLFAVVCGGAI